MPSVQLRVHAAPHHLRQARLVLSRQLPHQHKLRERRRLSGSHLLECRELAAQVADLALQHRYALQLRVHVVGEHNLAVHKMIAQAFELRVALLYLGQVSGHVQLVHGVERRARVHRAQRRRQTAVGHLSNRVLHELLHRLQVLGKRLQNARLLLFLPLHVVQTLLKLSHIHVRARHEQLLHVHLEVVEDGVQLRHLGGKRGVRLFARREPGAQLGHGHAVQEGAALRRAQPRVQLHAAQSLQVSLKRAQQLRMGGKLPGVVVAEVGVGFADVVEVDIHVLARRVDGQHLHAHLRHQPPAQLDAHLTRTPYRLALL
mmetsp:Transcript_1188/g.2150  ORF Transcript_1188/g.2150 Transcript_1188/m.2150 type:complete len:316 (+) Transcript_1188:629-1576(+)